MRYPRHCLWWSEEDTIMRNAQLREKACLYQNKGFVVACHNVMSNVSMGRGFDRDHHTHQISCLCNCTWTKQRPNVIKGLGISARRFGALLGSRLPCWHSILFCSRLHREAPWFPGDSHLAANPFRRQWRY